MVLNLERHNFAFVLFAESWWPECSDLHLFLDSWRSKVKKAKELHDRSKNIFTLNFSALFVPKAPKDEQSWWSFYFPAPSVLSKSLRHYKCVAREPHLVINAVMQELMQHLLLIALHTKGIWTTVLRLRISMQRWRCSVWTPSSRKS